MTTIYSLSFLSLLLYSLFLSFDYRGHWETILYTSYNSVGFSISTPARPAKYYCTWVWVVAVGIATVLPRYCHSCRHTALKLSPRDATLSVQSMMGPLKIYLWLSCSHTGYTGHSHTHVFVVTIGGRKSSFVALKMYKLYTCQGCMLCTLGLIVSN